MLGISYWGLAVGDLLLAVGYWRLAIGGWLFFDF